MHNKIEAVQKAILMKNLPTWLNQEAWSEWVQFRKEIKKKLVQTTINRQLKFLEKHKADHVLILEQSIMNGWTGLFEIKQQKNNQQQSSAEYVDEYFKKENEAQEEIIYAELG